MTGPGPRAVVVGEGMVELCHLDERTLRLGHGGDALNTAVHLARSGVDVAFATALGDDPYSAGLRRWWEAEGVSSALARVLPGRRCGLYLVRVDGAGERSFTYHRGDSAARDALLGDGAELLLDGVAAADLVHVTGVGLAVLGPSAARLLPALAEVRRRGGVVAFDSNHRPALWPSTAAAQEASRALLPLVSVALPTADDEAVLHGDDDALATARRLRRSGVPEVAVKDGSAGAVVTWDDREVAVPPPQVVRPVDTTGAGDAFDAGYLAARLGGAAPPEAAAAGNDLAAAVLACPGAVPPRVPS